MLYLKGVLRSICIAGTLPWSPCHYLSMLVDTGVLLTLYMRCGSSGHRSSSKGTIQMQGTLNAQQVHRNDIEYRVSSNAASFLIFSLLSLIPYVK